MPKIEWTKLHIGFIAIATAVLWPAFFYFNPPLAFKLSKFFSALGLYIDVVGVVLASLKTPYYGTFYDGGAIERKRAKVEEKYFQLGMLLVGFGFLLQAFGTIMP